MRARRFAAVLAVSSAILCSACAGIGSTDRRSEGEGVALAGLAERLEAHEARMAGLARDIEMASQRMESLEGRSRETRVLAGDALGLADQARVAATEAKNEAAQTVSAVRGMESQLSQYLSGRGRFVIVETRRVSFDFALAAPDDAAMTVLGEIARRLRDDPRLFVEVEGHTDSVGGAQANLRLSRERADAVARHLVRRHGIALHRLHILGLGSTAPISDNNSREGRARNRRVEIRVLAPEG